ncbi:MAG: DUF924 domain-containing protein [Richelia sp. RM2_1_2]|nr:DUF924 domain-containing protein [Richelia sp. SM2_1_7]NJM19695.1 DUF924 domain-containing protein [Richelia sp. SM1_7_0]NJN10996.1 DUF924 domain-containing protein [Richelia sp. RM1_1_1]NJO31037.1 DUF924 domain-containing protein [Richelia sp. SL_2_1]NJO61643.1 DUF924 domain-containing protein [Richelia sp. RM2_1_2]
MSQANEILNFWFGNPEDADYGKPKKIWFAKEPEFDEELRRRFLTDYEKAAAGYLDEWKDSPLTCLALILLLDQFPRNIFRETPQAFATDWEALSTAHLAIAQGYDRQLLNVQRWFVYLPFVHSENIDHQRQAVKLFQKVSGDKDSASAIENAIRHRAVIERFGRFPHRNLILGRLSTPEEKEFLKEPGARF